MITKISIEEAFKLKSAVFIDARTPKEFSEDHIIGAINIPLLSDEERHEIGIIYKQQSREKAIEKGMEIFPSKIPNIYNTVKDHKDKTIIVYCARGGMRSGIISSLLLSIGFKVLQLEGGYKSFRNYLLERLNNYKLKPKLFLLWGLTCSGKTQLLSKFSNSLDLEGLAQHRGSLYGAIGLKPNSQKKFENLLLQRLDELNENKFIFVEGESRKIGDVQIPSFFWKAMMKGTNILVKKDLDLRAKLAVDEYFTTKESFMEIKKVTDKLWKVIGKNKKQEVLDLLGKKKHLEAVKILLEYYYDPLYSHTLKNIKFTFEINNNDTEKAVEVLRNKIL
ncbi:MAG: tRNA 2-selenouridine(34) synthase MnmH [Nanoarchaeota archaeon]|nr:tRNA 2-selenouridine(34) synthase MnmH [Nanoarchaeota archaeon]MBU1632850.1 tRNA 2-selenouridine(34) synthase MnmH [Nanoarchaeota archaeon]MBU1875527.1 tRNA 2-selenouridine(34) synthase MnmH [Nanoarchaeota archaeon]